MRFFRLPAGHPVPAFTQPNPVEAMPALVDRERRSVRRVMNFATQLEGGGAQMVAAQLSSGFLEMGVESSSLAFLYEKRAFDLPGPKPSILLSGKPALGKLPGLFLNIFRLLRRHRPDVVLSHSVYTNLFVLPVAALLGVPHRITVQHNETDDVSPLFQWLYAVFHLLRVNTHTVFVSDASHESYVRKYRSFRSRSSVVKNLISIDWQSADPSAASLVDLQPGERLLFAVGRLSRQKNHAVLVEAMKQVPGCKLVIAGEGELRPDLEHRIKEAGLGGSVILAGEIPREKIVALFGMCDLFVMPSLYEGRSLAMLEAIQTGAPIVASRIPSFEEVLRDCPNDVALFDLDSPEDLAAKLRETIASLPPWKTPLERLQSVRERAGESSDSVNLRLCRAYCQNIGWLSGPVRDRVAGTTGKRNTRGVSKVWVAGLRGIPSLSGGVEQVVERLYPQLKELCEEQDMNVAITIANRSQYFPKRIDSFGSLRLRYISSPDVKGFESLLHSGYSLWSAFRDRADVIHLHAIGAWIWAPIARLLGLRVCLYHHGNDHLRDKWGFAARMFLRGSMHFGSLFAHRVYLLNPVHMANLPLITKGKVRIVPNGIDCGDALRGEEVAKAIEMENFLFVGRVTPEKNVLELIRAFNLLCQQRQITPRLRIIGPAAHGEEAYYETCRQEASLNPRIDFMGAMPPAEVKEHYRPEAVLTLLSSIEGMPMVALEAIAGGCRLLLSNIPEHEVFEENFAAKRVDPARPGQIVEAMKEMIDSPHDADHIIENMKNLKKNHNWQNSAMILRDDLQALLAGK